MDKIKLNLGGGDKPLAGYVNLDIKRGYSAYPLQKEYVIQDIPVGWQADEIRASHILEHFPYTQTRDILKHWISKLKPGGILKIAVPDFRKIVLAYANSNGNEPLAVGYLLGGQTDEYDYHKAIFDEPGLRKIMAEAGLECIQPWESEIADCASLPVSLNLMGAKPGEVRASFDGNVIEEIRESGGGNVPREALEPKPRPRTREVKVSALMSVPRLSITNNVACMFRTIAECGIPCKPGQGVFWHHVLTRQIEDAIREGFDVLLAVDFDSWFLPSHVMRLVELLVNTPQADAICAVQCQREHELPIMAIHDEHGLPVQQMPRSWFERPLTPIHIGHFGLTVFRASCFAKLGRPWFCEEPDPNGSWYDGRRDADVAFWGNFERAGCKLFMANEVNIGHLQEVCTFPGPTNQNWKPQHVYLRDINAGQIPAHCDPAYRIIATTGGEPPQRKE